MNLVQSLLRAILDLFFWRIFILVLIPPVAAIFIWGIISWMFWTPMLEFTQGLGDKLQIQQAVPEWFIQWFSIDTTQVVTGIAIGVALVLIILPLMFVTSQVIASVLIMPMVIKHVGKDFPRLEKKEGGLFRASIFNQLRSSVIYLVLWVVTMPLWMVPGMSFALPLILNGYLNYRLFAYDALSEHSNREEIRGFLRTRRLDFLILGILTSSLLLFPPLFLIVPLFTALSFTRFAMKELQSFRQGEKTLI